MTLPLKLLVLVTSCNAIRYGTMAYGVGHVYLFLDDLTEKIKQYEKSGNVLQLQEKESTCVIEGKLTGFNDVDAERKWKKGYVSTYTTYDDKETVDISYEYVKLVFERFVNLKGSGFSTCESTLTQIKHGLIKEKCKVRLMPTLMTLSFEFSGTYSNVQKCTLNMGVGGKDYLEPTRVDTLDCPVKEDDWNKLHSLLMDNKQKVLDHIKTVEDALVEMIQESLKKVSSCKLDVTTVVLPESQHGTSNQ